MEPPENYSVQEIHSALFANMVMQQGNMALMFMGKIPNPETGQVIRELEAARMFIDQLEMLHAKTQGNLDPEESALLGQTLMTVRMAFVEEAREAKQSKEAAQESPTQAPAPAPPAASPTTDPAADEKKKFVKKY